MKVLDLFSGIGGFSLGLERAGFKTVALCEINEWCRKVLKKHWPNVPIFEDVTKIGFEPMSSAEDSPAKTSASQAEAPALPASVPLSGGGYAEPFAWYDRATRSWRTWQRCLDGEWELWRETWPRSGMTRNGIAYQLPPLAPLTDETEYGSWPTPTVIDATMRATWKQGQKGRHGTQLAHIANNGRIHLGPKNWPTPTSRDWKDGSAKACANVPANGLLGRVVHQFPTPVSKSEKGGRMGLDGGAHARAKLVAEHGEQAMKELTGGSLNPTWVEWLMGYPLEWTALPDSEMPSSRKSSRRSAKQS